MPRQITTLESFRGIAATAVALRHSGFINEHQSDFIARSAIFVDFFFILSGFVLTYAYAEKIRRGYKFSDFLILRIGRLYPLHLVILLAWIPYIALKGFVHYQYQLGINPFEVNSALSLVSNIALINGLGFENALTWNYPAWSISTELFVYILFFAFALLTRRSYLLTIATVISLALYVSLYLLTNVSLLSTYQYGLIRCIGGFFLGVIVFFCTGFLKDSRELPFASIIEIALVVVTTCLILYSGKDKNVQLLTFTSFAVIVFVFSIQEKGVVSRLLSTRLFLILGVLSYSIYMVHALVFAVAGNLWEYVFSLPTISAQGPGGGSRKFFQTEYAFLINLTLISIVTGISYCTYQYIEKPWRDRARARVARRIQNRQESR